MKLSKEESIRVGKLERKAHYDGRICLSIYFHTDEATADEHAVLIEKRGDTYNGGIFHGMPCGREAARDYVDSAGMKRYAVTT